MQAPWECEKWGLWHRFHPLAVRAHRLAGGALDGLGQVLRGLRAGDGEDTAEDEAGDALDAGLLGGLGLPLDADDVGITRKLLAHPPLFKATLRGGSDQNLAIGEIGAFGEVELHQPLLHRSGIAALAGPPDQAVTIERIRLWRGLVVSVDGPFSGRRG